MSDHPLVIAGMGMLSCLGSGAQVNSTAMRCGYDGFTHSDFVNPRRLGEPLIVAPIAASDQGIKRHAKFAETVARQALSGEEQAKSDLLLFICLPEVERPGIHRDAGYMPALSDAISACRGGRGYHSDSRAILKGRSGFVEALQSAKSVLYGINPPESALIIALDSYLNNQIIHHFGGVARSDTRLLTESNANGFIPGEAVAGVVIHRAQASHEERIAITGSGVAQETVTLDDDEPVQAEGLTQAMRQACEEAGVEPEEIDFRIAAVTGEDYFFQEAARAQTQLLKHRVDDQPLWTPCSHVGEVGAAIGPIMTIMGAQAMQKGYAPGATALCHISNDGRDRGAFVLAHKGRSVNPGKEKIT